jgi:2-dehydro-3-deoxyphosphogluconate aldolase / (4S)-4-hydroxy-2-oxoglutarate aldolase
VVEIPPLGRHRILVSLPDVDSSELVSVCELLCQEGYTTWSVSVERLQTAVELMAVFGRRARFGVQGVSDVATVRRVAKAGAQFVATRLLAPKLVKAVPELPVILGGATPSELVAGLDAGAAAVQLWPADSYSQPTAAQLVGLLGGRPLIAAGEMDQESASGWLRAGAVGVWPTGLVGEAIVEYGGLDGLREQLHWWRPEL